MSETTAAPPAPRADDAWSQQQSYNFSGRVLLTAVVILFVIAVIFAVTRVLLYYLVVRPRVGGGRRGLAGGIFRSLNSFGMSGRRGLDASALAALPVTAYVRRNGGAGEGSDRRAPAAAADCAVCLSELADGEKVRELPNCGHVFHVECVDAWLRSRTTCPLCRAEAEVPKSRVQAAAATPTTSSSLGTGGITVVVTIHGGTNDAGGDRVARGSTVLTGQPGPS
ncbi:RING-H2 finger protein ATL39-like [Oryza brachyantha]|uniref:RING-H2 finger protein ATL39-like n=1 Tax=Oryza brachyantha TaxID=4533 RepID=UPI001ADC0025|nr:RING-H2 finger protein ATL39-like [Oryza brachyantha]